MAGKKRAGSSVFSNGNGKCKYRICVSGFVRNWSTPAPDVADNADKSAVKLQLREARQGTSSPVQSGGAKPYSPAEVLTD